MPSDLLHGQSLELTFSITSSRHVEYTEKVQLWIDRSQAKPKPARKHNLRGEPAGIVGPTVAVPFSPVSPMTQGLCASDQKRRATRALGDGNLGPHGQ
jgi:hypothetical protein